MERSLPPLSREEIAKREIGRTDISPALARAMVAVFLATIVAVPVIQSTDEMLLHRKSGTDRNWPSWCGIASALDGVGEAYRNPEGSQATRILAANARLLQNVHEYEKRLEDESFLSRTLLGPTQYWLTRLGGLGNEKAYIGLSGWLFFRPSIDYVTGPGFLEEATLARRRSGGNEYTSPPEPDPRPAILEFQKRLARSGIRLILMPTPAKPMIEPERFSARYRERRDVVQNRSFQKFKAEMTAAGVLVYDPAPVLLAQKRQTGHPQFLKTDTHWTPEAMQAVAKQLHEFIAEHVALPAQPTIPYRSRAQSVSNLGDVAVMMKLPPDQELFPSEQVTVRRIFQPDGAPWQPMQNADVLLLGDSFTNIYSMPELSWGEAAGFAEHLSYVMGRAVDRIAQNDAGAFATRQALALELARGNDRLAGKHVLIWQFAIRELAVGDWKRVPWNDARPSLATPAKAREPAGSGTSLVKGRIKAISAVPVPGSVPYRDAILAVHLGDLESLRGAGTGAQALVYLWGMRDNRLTSAARYRPGQTVTLELTPWEQASARYGRFTRVELDDSDLQLIDLPTFWADEAIAPR